MELWLDAEIRVHRDDVYALAKRAHYVRLCKAVRSTSIRATMADGAVYASDAFSRLAAWLRGAPPEGPGVTLLLSDRREPPEPDASEPAV